ncbi:S-formylglutathione hydrolase [Rhodospirillaceae bacterium RKSG073]|nr:S-formylglutathione hydrolase [Curvivirga aplysinae]
MMEQISSVKVFGGEQRVYKHASSSTSTDMEFAVFLPEGAEGQKLSCLFYLSGLTCTWENMMSKAGAQQYAAAHNMILVAPDTSPRGEDVPDDEMYDFGKGAGFYVNATQEPWSKNFHMYDYVTKELYKIICDEFPVDPGRIGITGHSMGGHGALTVAMKNPDLFKSVSAFSPIVAPSQVPWGEKALGGYLGADKSAWSDYDACELVKSKGWSGDILVDQGLADNFLEEQLKSQLLEEACKEADVSLTLRMQDGYDHSYYFIASFIEDHIKWHAERLS